MVPRAVRCTQAAGDAVSQLGIEIRAGLHTDEIELFGENIGGMALAIGARFARLAEGERSAGFQHCQGARGEVRFRFCDRGTRVLKGVLGEWCLFAVER